jgi:2-polyprenyl-6-hydroxyphenyl methylase/3-demethylubiquinone-9 3-methyltransferase
MSDPAKPDLVRFEFGANWSRFLQCVDEQRVQAAELSLGQMLGSNAIAGQTFLDAGSGSGLFSLAAVRMGASRVHSFDYDQHSVATTAELKRRFGPPDANWTVERGDVLDAAYVGSLGRWDIVYSWGVLHHTGRMWQAITNACDLVADGGLLFIAIYNDQGRKSRWWRSVKRLYSASAAGKAVVGSIFIPYWAVRGFFVDLIRFRNPLARYRAYKSERGMSLVHDWIDWLGGYPFEAARPEIVVRYVIERGFSLRNLTTVKGGLGCNEFVFERRGRS